MKRTPVESSLVASAGYAPKTRTLEIQFHSGKIYRYYDVPEEVYTELMEADSVGRYFNAEIRGAFSYEQCCRQDHAATRLADSSPALEGTMKRTPVESSLVASAGYDSKNRMLEIQFHSDKIYRYYDVPEEVYKELMEADSVGSYFNAEIRGAFSYEQVR